MDFDLQDTRPRTISGAVPGEVLPASMIVCSCNVLSDAQVRSAVADAAPRSAVRVYGCLGCSPQCGRCIATIRRIMDEALGGCPEAGGCAGGESA